MLLRAQQRLLLTLPPVALACNFVNDPVPCKAAPVFTGLILQSDALLNGRKRPHYVRWDATFAMTDHYAFLEAEGRLRSSKAAPFRL